MISFEMLQRGKWYSYVKTNGREYLNGKHVNWLRLLYWWTKITCLIIVGHESLLLTEASGE